MKVQVLKQDGAGAVLLALAFGLFYGWVGVRPAFNGLLADGHVYLAAGRELSLGLRADLPFLDFLAAHYPFPPLLPLLLALTDGSPVAVFRLQACVLGMVIGLTWLLLRAMLLPRALALGVTLVFALLPATLAIAMNVSSEPLYLLLTLGALALWPADDRSPRLLYCVALLLGLAAVTRSIGCVGLMAFGIVWLGRRHWRSAPWAPLAAVLPWVLWQGLRLSRHYASYAGSDDAVASLWRRLMVNAAAYAHHGLRLFAPQGAGAGAWCVTALAVLALGTGLYRLRQWRLDAWWLAGHLAVLALWPHPDHAERFLWPLLPVLLGWALLGVSHCLDGRVTLALHRSLTLLVPAVLLLGAAPESLSLLLPLTHASSPGQAEALRSPYRHLASPAAAAGATDFERRLTPLMEAVAALPPESCVQTLLPERVLRETHRRALDLAPTTRAPSLLEAELLRCPYLLMVAARPYPPVPGAGPLYPLDLLRERLTPLAAVYREPGREDSGLLGLLARVSPATGSPAAP